MIAGINSKIAGQFVDPATLLLGMLGVGTYGAQYFGGGALALVGAWVAHRIIGSGIVPDAKPLGLITSLMVGLFMAIVTVQVVEAIWPGLLPVQTIMAISGFVSPFTGPLVLKVMSRISNRSDHIANRLVDRIAPGKDDDAPK